MLLVWYYLSLSVSLITSTVFQLFGSKHAPIQRAILEYFVSDSWIKPEWILIRAEYASVLKDVLSGFLPCSVFFFLIMKSLIVPLFEASCKINWFSLFFWLEEVCLYHILTLGFLLLSAFLPMNRLVLHFAYRWKEENQSSWQWIESCLEWRKWGTKGHCIVGNETFS